MRRVKLLVELQGPEGPIPAGTELVVNEAEARTLLGAIGLAEDLGAEVGRRPAKEKGGQ